jgi:hypothetical protein
MVGIKQRTTEPARPRKVASETAQTTQPETPQAKLNALNPYSFTVDGYGAPTPERIAKYDRVGPAPDPRADVTRPAGTFSPIAMRIAQMAQDDAPPVDHAALLAAMRDHPAAHGSVGKKADGTPLPSVLSLFPPRSKVAIPEAMKALVDFAAKSADGALVMSLQDKIVSSRALSPEGKSRVLDILVTAHDSLRARGGDASYNLVAWTHLAAEVGQVLDVAELRGLHKSAAGREKAEDAVVASVFSDLVKFRETLLDHNVHGAIAAATLLQGKYPEERLAGIVQATLEHQIGPPRFMAMIAKMKMEGANGGPSPIIDAIRDKLADPLNPEHVELTPAGAARVRFSDEERAMLGKIGLDDWYVPHPSTPWFDASSTVIDADSLVNYVTPEGVGKIVAISGPDTPFKDPTVFDSMFSSGASYVDAVGVMSDVAMAPVAQGVQRTKDAIDQVRTKLDPVLRSGVVVMHRDALERLMDEEKVDRSLLNIVREGTQVRIEVPTTADGGIAFWNEPLDYPAGGPPYEFAKLLRRIVADELRAL